MGLDILGAVWYRVGMKVTPLDQSSVPFDPADAPRGTLMIDVEGDLCMRTDEEWDGPNATVYLTKNHAGWVANGGNGPYTKATGAYRIEND